MMRIYLGDVEYLSLNTFIRMHKAPRAQWVKRIHDEAKEQWMAATPQLLELPVEFEFQHISARGKLYDADNYVSMTKPIMDAAVEAGLIKDDGPKHVKRVILNAGRRPMEFENITRSVLIAEIRGNDVS